MKSLINETKNSPLALLIAVTSISPRTLRLNLLQKTAILVESARHNDSVSPLPPFVPAPISLPSAGPTTPEPLSVFSLAASGSSRVLSALFRFSSSAFAAHAILIASSHACRRIFSVVLTASASTVSCSRALSALRRAASATVVAALLFFSSTRLARSLAHEIFRLLSCSSIFL